MNAEQINAQMEKQAGRECQTTSREFRWAVKSGIIEEDDPCRLLNSEELAGVLYRTLMYFWGQIISILEVRKE